MVYRWKGVKPTKPGPRPLFEILPVLADVLPPLGRHGEFIKNGIHRAYSLAVRAVDARLGIYVIHVVFIGGDDAVHRANFDTTRVFDANARLGDYIRHTGNIGKPGSCGIPDKNRTIKLDYKSGLVMSTRR